VRSSRCCPNYSHSSASTTSLASRTALAIGSCVAGSSRVRNALFAFYSDSDRPGPRHASGAKGRSLGDSARHGNLQPEFLDPIHHIDQSFTRATWSGCGTTSALGTSGRRHHPAPRNPLRSAPRLSHHPTPPLGIIITCVCPTSHSPETTWNPTNSYADPRSDPLLDARKSVVSDKCCSMTMLERNDGRVKRNVRCICETGMRHMRL
jgi:hypothetical protein